MRFRRSILAVSLMAGLAAPALAGAVTTAYVGSSDGDFGTMDLGTGAFTNEGNSGQTLAGLAVANGKIFATNYHVANETLFNVNPATGALTTVGGASGVDMDDFGSTTGGMYAVSFGATQDLYQINPTTGAATLIGPTGLGYGSWRSLSTNSSTLYFADGPDLYTLSTTTGASTLVGAFGSGAEMGVMMMENGVLYGGDNTNNTVDSINISTGAATVGPTPSGFSGSFYGMAPYPVPIYGNGVPEPATWAMMLAGLFGLGGALRRRREPGTATA